jgi:hypothetical protein
VQRYTLHHDAPLIGRTGLASNRWLPPRGIHIPPIAFPPSLVTLLRAQLAFTHTSRFPIPPRPRCSRNFRLACRKDVGSSADAPRSRSGLQFRLGISYLLPRLAKGFCAQKYGDLADAIELGRNRRGTPLDSFEMKWRCHQGDDDIDLLMPPPFRINQSCLQDLIARGMHISIVSQAGKRSEVWI